MKNIAILLFALALWFGASAQPSELTGGMGLNFGSSKEAARMMMKTKHPDATFDEEKNNILFYQGGTWLGRKVVIWAFLYDKKGELHTITLHILPPTTADVYDVYNHVVNDLSSKYGKASGVIENWKYPYEAKDKYDHGITALKLGKCSMMTYWQWVNQAGMSEGTNNTILVEITKDLDTKVTYQDGVRIKAANAERLEDKQDEM